MPRRGETLRLAEKPGREARQPVSRRIGAEIEQRQGEGRRGAVVTSPGAAMDQGAVGGKGQLGQAAGKAAPRLDLDYRQAARLVDPRSASKLTSLEAALGALGYAIAIAVDEKPAA